MNKILFFIVAFSFIWMSCKPSSKAAAMTVSIKNEVIQDSLIQDSLIPDEQIAKAKEIIAAVTPSELEDVDVKAKYTMLCAMCHGMDGQLNANGAKDLNSSTFGLEENVALIYHGKGFMPAYNGTMSDAEIVAIAIFLKEQINEK